MKYEESTSGSRRRCTNAKCSTREGTKSLSGQRKKCVWREWPKFENYEEFVAAQPAILERALRLSRLSHCQNVDPDDVFGRMLQKIQAYWYKIPKETGQATYLSRIFHSCLLDELRFRGRSTIAPSPEKLWASQCLDLLADTAQVDPDGATQFAEVSQAIDELQKDYPIHTWILVLRGALGWNWADIAASVGLCKKTCQNYYRRIKKVFCERYPHLRGLLGEVQ